MGRAEETGSDKSMSLDVRKMDHQSIICYSRLPLRLMIEAARQTIFVRRGGERRGPGSVLLWRIQQG